MSNLSWGKICLRCVAIAGNALWAGGLYSFPLFSPALVEHHHFTQPQLTTIALAGMVGQYPIAALVGKVFDTRGARTCSFVAGICFSLGFGLFAYEIAGVPPKDTSTTDTTGVFRRMVLYFGLIGVGTVFSYFSFVFSATRTFPHYIGVASGTSMALFGCSPLLLSVIAERISTKNGALNVTHFLSLLAIVTGAVHLFGAGFLPGRSPTTSLAPREAEDAAGRVSQQEISTSEARVSSAETSPLLSRRHSVSPLRAESPKKAPSIEVDIVTVERTEVAPPQHGSTLDLAQDPHFWALIAAIAVVVGCAEMVITNLSFIFLSLGSLSISALAPLAPQAAGSSITTQVQLLSFSNTISRLVIGPLADFIAPVPISYMRPTVDLDSRERRPSPGSSRYELGDVNEAESAPLIDDNSKSLVYYAFPRRHYLSRIAFLLGACTLLLLAFVSFVANNAAGAPPQEASMGILSVGVGASYGTTFTILPGILSAIYGPANLGRNFGIISYAPFVGTTIFSYLYAFLANRASSVSGEPVSSDGDVCRGPHCWQTTFSICIAALAFAGGVSTVLWRRWRGRV